MPSTVESSNDGLKTVLLCDGSTERMRIHPLLELAANVVAEPVSSKTC